MNGFVICKNYYVGVDRCSVHLVLRPFDGAWIWMGGSMLHATVIAKSVAEAMAAQLQHDEPDVTISVVEDYYRRAPSVTEVPVPFRSAA